MFKLGNWKHLRITFSYYLMPVFIFSMASTPNLNPDRLLIVFIALHIFLYPSSNGYNSYFDKDEGSIGGLKNPPKVTTGLYYLSLLLFIIALALGTKISWSFMWMMAVYGIVSMAYSHPLIRIKKYAFLSWLIAGFFQGYFTFCMVYAGINDFGWDVMIRHHVIVPGLLSSIILWGSYPLTQVYQHQEDKNRGDLTLSLKLGIKGTFLFSSIWFLFAGICYGWFFVSGSQQWAFYGFLTAMLPVILYFFIWYTFVNKDPEKYASYSWVMWMNRISATALNIFFAWYFIETSQILQLMG